MHAPLKHNGFMYKLDSNKRAQVLGALVEGASIRAINRMTGVARNTISTLLMDAGRACAAYQDAVLRNLPAKRIQCDEIWSFVGAKDKNVPVDRQNEFGFGSVWTWTAIDADTKLICSWMVGNRDADAAYEFMKDLKSRLANRVQLTTDGHTSYVDAIENTFGSDIDYAQLVKIYGAPRETEARYSPAVCNGAKKHIITGKPDRKHISTSYVERQNLTMRMHMRRFTRLTNAFSKDLAHHIAAVSLHMMFYNFVRIHQTLRVTPAMAAGISAHMWEIADIVKLVEAAEIERKADNFGVLHP
jgi:IS1 family transposase